MMAQTTRALPELLDFIVDNRGRTCPTVDSGFPLIATNCLKPGKREPVFENIRYVDDQTYSGWFRAHPIPGDVVFVCKGSPGRVAMVPDPVPFCIAQDMVALRANPRLILGDYLYYRLLSPDVQAGIANMHVGTMIPHFKRGDFGKLRFEVHDSLTEQRAIAKVLGALDDKIAANERTGSTLSELEDTRFVDAIRGVTSDVVLAQVATVTKGVSYRRSDLAESRTALVTLKSIDRGGRFVQRGFKPFVGDYKASQVVWQGDIVVAQTDLTQAAEVIGWAVRVPKVKAFSGLVASLDLGVVRPTAHVPGEYLLAALRQRNFRVHCQARMSGTTVLHLGRGAIESYRVPVLEPAEMARFAEVSRGHHELVDSLDQEVDFLRRMRDELLPLLMSGKVRVRDAEKVVEGVI